jgi:hypothetical protein
MTRNDVSVYTTQDAHTELLEYSLRTATDNFYVQGSLFTDADGSGIAIANQTASQNPECVLVEPQDVDKLITVIGAARDSCMEYKWADSEESL